MKYKLYAFDTEDDTRGNFIMGGVTDGERVWYFKNPDDMRRFMESCPDPLARFIAHNLEYDLGNVYRGHYDRLKPKWNRSRLLWSEAVGMKARYFNSFCHAPIKLAEMGDIIGLKKLEFPYHKIRHVATDRIKRYLSRDLEILWTFMDRLQDLYVNLGSRLAPTAPGSAMSLYRAWTPEYCAKRLDIPFLDTMKTAYYGGRTEAFYRGKWSKPFHYSDVHSMYPWAMQGDFPNFHIWKKKAPKEGECGIIDATVRVPKSEFMPPLPMRGERLLFPAGTFRGTWTREEVDACGIRIEKIHGGVTFPVNAGPVLAHYTDKLYKLRLGAKNQFEKWLYKMLMNSLYGKFASAPSLWTLISEDEYVEKSGPSSGRCFCEARPVWDGSVYLVQEALEGYPIHTNYIWPALITGRARSRLFLDGRSIMTRGGEIFYCDTDSLIYSGRGNLGSDPALGRWGTETHRDEDLEIRGPKMYRIGDEYRVKGVPSKNLSDTGKETRPAKEFFETGHARFRRPVRLREAMGRRAAKNPTTPDCFGIPNFWVDVEKSFNEDGAQKRVWKKDGWSEPIVLG